MNAQRKISQARKSTADLFLEAKRRFQFKPVPSRKPHVYDIVATVPKMISLSREPDSSDKSVHKEGYFKEVEPSELVKDSICNSKDINDSRDLKQNRHVKNKSETKLTKTQVLPQKYYRPKPLPIRNRQMSSLYSCEINNDHKENQTKNVSSLFNNAKTKTQILPKTRRISVPDIKPACKPGPNIPIQKPIRHKRSVFAFQKSSDLDITVLKISQPETCVKWDSGGEGMDISLTQLDIQIQGIKQYVCEPLFYDKGCFKITPAKKYKYDTSQTEENQPARQSVLNLSPVKQYHFDRENKDEERRRKQSIQLKKTVREPIMQEQQDKSTDSRVLQQKFGEIFQLLDTTGTGIIKVTDSYSPSLYPEVKGLVTSVLSKTKLKNRSINKKQFVSELKKASLGLQEREIAKIVKCPVHDTRESRHRTKSLSGFQERSQKTFPFKPPTKEPYMRLNTQNSVGDIELSKLSYGDELDPIQNQKTPSRFCKPSQKIVMRQKSNMESWYNAVQSQLQVSRIDALNQRLSMYIQRNNIQEKSCSSSQINLEFGQLKKHLGLF